MLKVLISANVSRYVICVVHVVKAQIIGMMSFIQFEIERGDAIKLKIQNFG